MRLRSTINAFTLGLFFTVTSTSAVEYTAVPNEPGLTKHIKNFNCQGVIPGAPTVQGLISLYTIQDIQTPLKNACAKLKSATSIAPNPYRANVKTPFAFGGKHYEVPIKQQKSVISLGKLTFNDMAVMDQDSENMWSSIITTPNHNHEAAENIAAYPAARALLDSEVEIVNNLSSIGAKPRIVI
ncbi:hypothetical protein K3495_g14140, partial [Podosphaera aphanis]